MTATEYVPTDHPCGACDALPKEDCFPGCVGRASYEETVAGFPVPSEGTVWSGLVVWESIGSDPEDGSSVGQDIAAIVDDYGWSGGVAGSWTLPSGEVVLYWHHDHGLRSVTLHQPHEPIEKEDV